MQQRRLNLPVRPRPVQQPPRETPQTRPQNPAPAPQKELTRLYSFLHTKSRRVLQSGQYFQSVISSTEL